jgi:hypothetical protein
VDERSLAPRPSYVFYRGRPDGTEKPVSEHSDFECGWQAGTHVVTVEDKENDYSLYERRRRVAKFGHSRLLLRVDAERMSSMMGVL